MKGVCKTSITTTDGLGGSSTTKGHTETCVPGLSSKGYGVSITRLQRLTGKVIV